MRSPLCFAIVLLAGVGLGCEEKAPPAPAPKPSASKAATTPSLPSAQAPIPGASTGQVTPPVPTGTQPPPPPIGGNSVNVLGVSFALPSGWKSVPPANQMRLAEVQVPDASGDAAKACTMIFATAMGDVDSNIARWGTQVLDASGKPTVPQPSVREVAGMKVHTVELTGAFMNMGESAPHQNWMLRGSVVETPQGLLFIKMFGPVEQMKAAGAGYASMVDGMKK